MKIIGISGKRGVGKTTLAKLLAKKYNFKKISFADPLKTVAKALIPFTDLDFSDPKKKESKYSNYDWTPREFLINLGEFMRYHDPFYWLNVGIDQCKEPEGLYVFDDVRYTNEADALRAKGAKIVRLNRYEKENPYGKNLDIESETQLDGYNFDLVIHEFQNNSIQALTSSADRVAELVEV